MASYVKSDYWVYGCDIIG